MRWVAWGVAGLAGLVLVVLVAGWFLLDRFDLAPIASRRATAALGREVSFGSLHVTPGRWLRVSVRDARMANLPGGTRPEMATLTEGTAEVAAWPLLHGAVVLRAVKVDGLDVLLERVGDKGPNWHTKPEPPKDGQAPHRDGSFPELSRLTVSGKITVRTGSGTELPIGLDGVTFTAPAPDQPARLAGPASYKGIPIRLTVDLGSIDQYRDADRPFPATVDMVADGKTHLRFEGTFVDPLNVDGAKGQLLIEAPTPATLFRIAGIESTIDPGVKLQGPFEHAGNDWKLSQIQGALGQAAIYGGELHLVEGSRATDTAPLSPDRLGVALQFEHLDVDALMGRQKKSGGDDMSLAVEAHPSTLVAAKLRAKDVTYSRVRFSDVALDASQTEGEVAVEAFSVAYLGGKVSAEGKVQAGAEGSRVTADLRLAGIEVQALRGLLDMGRLPVTGRLNGRATIAATGDTVNAALPGARASLVITMAGGGVSRQIVQLGSTDLRALFGSAQGTVPVSCVLGVMDLRGGVATVSPLRLRTAEGTIAAKGTVDVLGHRLDLTVASEARTTGPLALDVPIRVSGSFSDPSFAPAALSGAGRAQVAAPDEIGRLPAGLQAIARASPCLGR